MFLSSKTLTNKKSLTWPLFLPHTTSFNSIINLWKMFINSHAIALLPCPSFECTLNED